jgi:hypothetical protein
LTDRTLFSTRIFSRGWFNQPELLKRPAADEHGAHAFVKDSAAFKSAYLLNFSLSIKRPSTTAKRNLK